MEILMSTRIDVKTDVALHYKSDQTPGLVQII
jgi:hypothetical protein